jgi:hypothetical protein
MYGARRPDSAVPGGSPSPDAHRRATATRRSNSSGGFESARMLSAKRAQSTEGRAQRPRADRRTSVAARTTQTT